VFVVVVVAVVIVSINVGEQVVKSPQKVNITIYYIHEPLLIGMFCARFYIILET